MTTPWNDFNDVQPASNIIPKGTIAKVRLTIRPGGFDDPSQGWTGGYATRGNSGAVYLNSEFTVTEGQYAKRKIFSLIGLYSPKGPDWANMGRTFIKSLLNSAHGLSEKDTSQQAQALRRIKSFTDLDGIEFLARIDTGSDTNGDEKNDIRTAVTIDHKHYASVAGPIPQNPQVPQASAAAQTHSATPVSTPTASAPSPMRPAWAR